MQVAGAQQTYAVDNAQLLQKLRVGNTVQFSWQDRNGQMYITDVR
jgi:Cu/Ag efflux protein CusF